jgi:hypothetical protein
MPILRNDYYLSRFSELCAFVGINNAPQQQANLDLAVLTDDEFEELHRLYRKYGTTSPA